MATASGKADASRFRVVEHLAPTPFFARSVVLDRDLGRRVIAYFAHDAAFELNEDNSQRVATEAQRARRLVHPHIVRTRAAGRHGQIPFATEEMITAPPLRDALRRDPPLSRDAQFRAIVHLCEGMAYAHGQGLMHGGISPSDLRVGPEGEAWVGGFGTGGALARSGLGARATVAQRGAYAAPEERRGAGPSNRTDVFALGVAACELLGGTPLDPATDATAAVEGRLAELSRRSDVPHAVIGALRRAVSRLPDDRQRSAADLLTALREAVPAPETPWTGLPEADDETEQSAPRRPSRDITWWQFLGRTLAANLVGAIKVALTLVAIFAAVGGAFLYAVSQSPQDVLVPEVVGKQVGEAERVLSDHNLQPVRGESVYSSKHPAGVVVRTRPYGKKRVKERREVELTVSMGARQYRVPSVAKLPLDEAKSRLRQAGFKTDEVTEEHTSAVKKGAVIRQTPSGGSRAGRQTPVALVVSKGRKPRERGGDASNEEKFGLVQITVPEGRPFQRVRVRVVEANDRPKTAYDRVHKPGERLEVRVSGRGDYKVQVYLDHRKVREAVCDW